MTERLISEDCVMCGSPNPRIVYCDNIHIAGFQNARDHREYLGIVAFGDRPNPHMHCTCMRCRYEWTMPALQTVLPTQPVDPGSTERRSGPRPADAAADRLRKHFS